MRRSACRCRRTCGCTISRSRSRSRSIFSRSIFCSRAPAAPSWRSATTRSRHPPWASTSRCTRRWRSGSAPASPALPAASARSPCSSSHRTATPSRSRSRCFSAWWSAAWDGCPDRSSAQPSSSSCRTSRREFRRVFRARCSACFCSSSSSWCRTAQGRSPLLPSN